MALHTILGASGPIGRELSLLVERHAVNVRQISPRTGMANAISPAMMDYEQLVHAISGSVYVYMLMKPEKYFLHGPGEWLSFVRNIVNACKENRAKLIFLDDASYYRSRPDSLFTEDADLHPAGNVGRIALQTYALLQREMAEGLIRAVVARSVDSYGPGVVENSIAGRMVFARMAAGKRPVWPFDPDVPRAFHYIPDIAKALYLLATAPGSTGRIWHLPAPEQPITGREFIRLAAAEMKFGKPMMVWPKWRYHLAKWLHKDMTELRDLLPQDAFPLHFNSSRFVHDFNFPPTSYVEGIRTTAAWFGVSIDL